MEILNSLTESLRPFWQQLDWVAWSVLGINMLLVMFARQIIRLVQHGKEGTSSFSWKLHTLRGFNIMIIIGYFYFNVYDVAVEHTLGIRIVAILAILYVAYLAMYISHYLILLRFGREVSSNGETRQADTYNSRLLNILSNVLIAIMGLISVVQLMGFETLLEAGGVIGFIGVFLALTQSSWAPDIFGGLIILNSDLLKEGDVVELRGAEKIIGTVFRTKVFHSEILNLVNNHRILISNANLREYAIHNLSKFASAKGLRENLHFKIGYDTPAEKVREMFDAAFEEVKVNSEIAVESQHPLEIGVYNNGDHAVEWVIFYYIKDVSKVLKTRLQMQELVLQVSIEHGIALSTPLTHQVQRESV